MAAYSTRTVNVLRHETALSSPTNWVEMEKALSAVRQQLEHAGRALTDDAVWIESRDEEIVLVWTEEKTVTP